MLANVFLVCTVGLPELMLRLSSIKTLHAHRITWRTPPSHAAHRTHPVILARQPTRNQSRRCALFASKTRDVSDVTRAFPPFYLLRERLRRGLHVNLERGSCVLRSLRCSYLFWFVVASTPNGFFQTACEPLVFWGEGGPSLVLISEATGRGRVKTLVKETSDRVSCPAVP